MANPATSLKDISVGQQNCKVFGHLIRLWDAINMRSKYADPLISIDGTLLDEHGSIAQITVPKREQTQDVLLWGQYGESFNEDATLHKSKDKIVVAIFAGLTTGKFSGSFFDPNKCPPIQRVQNISTSLSPAAITEASSSSATEIYIDLDTPQVREFHTRYKLLVTITDESGSLDAVAFSFVAEDLVELDAAQASQNMKIDPADHPTALNNAIGKTKIFAIGMNTDTSSKFPISYVLKKSFTIEPTMSVPMLTDGEQKTTAYRGKG
uniref:Replication protein A OB domain-containing protein n=1 Tax=Oryza nivara TaxID=4536 RepID=A0A0E0HR70_ORYNI